MAGHPLPGHVEERASTRAVAWEQETYRRHGGAEVPPPRLFSQGTFPKCGLGARLWATSANPATSPAHQDPAGPLTCPGAALDHVPGRRRTGVTWCTAELCRPLPPLFLLGGLQSSLWAYRPPRGSRCPLGFLLWCLCLEPPELEARRVSLQDAAPPSRRRSWGTRPGAGVFTMTSWSW